MYAETLEWQPRILLYEEMMERLTDSHPFLLVRLAEMYLMHGAGSLAVNLFYQVKTFRCPLSGQLNEPSITPGPRYFVYNGGC
jgi:hypothetical protein